MPSWLQLLLDFEDWCSSIARGAPFIQAESSQEPLSYILIRLHALLTRPITSADAKSKNNNKSSCCSCVCKTFLRVLSNHYYCCCYFYFCKIISLIPVDDDNNNNNINNNNKNNAGYATAASLAKIWPIFTLAISESIVTAHLSFALREMYSSIMTFVKIRAHTYTQ